MVAILFPAQITICAIALAKFAAGIFFFDFLAFEPLELAKILSYFIIALIFGKLSLKSHEKLKRGEI